MTAYHGVMAARIEAEREEPADRGPAPAERRDTADSGEVREVSLTAFRVMFPGIVSGGTTGVG